MTLNIDTSRFENVFIYVADGLRYDFVPDKLREYGSVTTTIASGASTPTSFSSMITGHFPPTHGVYKFSHRLDEDLSTFLDFLPNRVFTTDTKHSRPIRETLNLSHIPETDLSTVDTPFVYLYRDLTSHSPFPLTETGELPDTSEEYWATRKRDTAQVRRDYESGARRSVDLFEQKLAVLDERGILDETLVVFTSDHGEHLGEHGMVTHGPPTSPLLVYVPTVFCNDGVSFDAPFFAHVDLFPTIATILGVETDGDRPGVDLTKESPTGRKILNQAWLPYVQETSVWDGDGGYVFSEASVVDRLRWFKRLLYGSATAPFHRRGPHRTLKSVFEGDRKYDAPGFSEAEAKRFYDYRTSDAESAEDREISESARQRLEELGYRDEI